VANVNAKRATVEKNVKNVPSNFIDQEIKQKMNVPIVVATQMELQGHQTEIAMPMGNVIV